MNCKKMVVQLDEIVMTAIDCGKILQSRTRVSNRIYRV